MFVELLKRRNPALIEASLDFYHQNLIEPDSYVVDVDQTLKNAQMILDEANKKGIRLYFMMKQLGRNPYLAKKFSEMGYAGAVAVDFRELEVMMRHQIPLGHVGHLVQIPSGMLESVLSYGAEVITVYSLDKLKEIDRVAKKLNIYQDVLIKVVGKDDMLYSGQESGIEIDALESFILEAKQLQNIHIVGATNFPCFIYDPQKQAILPIANHDTVLRAVAIMEALGLEIKQINLPSVSCVKNLRQIEGEKIYFEPGHGLTGTTPAHAQQDLEEIPSVLYLSEISHQFRGCSYAYGGGYYRRSMIKNALVYGQDGMTEHEVMPLDPTSIDYYFKLDGEAEVGSPVIMAFRFQIFVTRSRVVLIEGLSQAKPNIVGIYDSQGSEVR